MCIQINFQVPGYYNILCYTIFFLFISDFHEPSLSQIMSFVGLMVLRVELILAKQVLYHLSHLTSPFCAGYFEIRVSLYAH
jgi:hypothetical protein